MTTPAPVRTMCPRCGATCIPVTMRDGRRTLFQHLSTVPGVASSWGAHQCGAGVQHDHG
jgi:hypothetical protein